MKIMVISDLHYNRRVFHGIDESKAWSWLLNIIDYHGPDLLISLGDWGEGITEEEFYQLLKKVRVWSIFGNHENMEILRKMYNVLTNKYEPVLMGDGEIRIFNNTRFGAINGIIAYRRRERKGVPRKRPEEFIEYGKKLAGKVDVLLLYDSPWIPLPEYQAISKDDRTKTVEETIKVVKPGLVFCGHLHISPYTAYGFDFGTLYVRIDSSQKHRCYSILYPDSMKVEVWRDFEVVDEVEV